MPIVFVLINTAPLHGRDVYNILHGVTEIIEIHPLYGEYDFIVKIEDKDFKKVYEVIHNKIKTVDGIIYTKTLKGKNSLIDRKD